VQNRYRRGNRRRVSLVHPAWGLSLLPATACKSRHAANASQSTFKSGLAKAAAQAGRAPGYEARRKARHPIKIVRRRRRRMSAGNGDSTAACMAELRGSAGVYRSRSAAVSGR